MHHKINLFCSEFYSTLDTIKMSVPAYAVLIVIIAYIRDENISHFYIAAFDRVLSKNRKLAK